MPRYYFPIIDNDRVIFDEEGIDLPDLETAIREARHGAYDMLNDAITSGDVIAHQVIRVTDAKGRRFATIQMTEAMARR
jgi:hypothetical protein